MTTASDPRSRRSSTPTTTTGRSATPSPATATRSSPTAACRLDGRRRQAPLLLRRAAASDHPRPRRRAPAAPARRALRLLRRQERQGAGRQRARRARTRGAHPEWFDRDARLALHGRAGRRGGLAVPVAGRLHGGPDAARHRGRHRHPPGVQPLARRRLGLRLPGPDLRRAVPHAVRPRRAPSTSSSGASTAAPASSRSATARSFTPEGTTSPADPMFDPFWARVAEAGIVVAPHAGFEDGYAEVDAGDRRGRGAERVGRGRPATPTHSAVSTVSRCPAHEASADPRLRRRPGRRTSSSSGSPGLRVAYIENGADLGATVPPRAARARTVRTPACSASDPVDQFIEHCWVAPFVEDNVDDLARHLPGRADPVRLGLAARRGPGASHATSSTTSASFSLDDQRKIMVDNARSLTFA